MITKLKKSIEECTCKLGKLITTSELEKYEEKVTELMAERNANIVTEQISQLNSTDGIFYQAGLWKVKNKIWPRPKDPPMAKRDAGGNLVTAPLPLKKLYVETYKKRLENRPIKVEHKDLFDLKTKLWELRYNEVKNVKSSPRIKK